MAGIMEPNAVDQGITLVQINAGRRGTREDDAILKSRQLPDFNQGRQRP
jgi:hypothetical protein